MAQGAAEKNNWKAALFWGHVFKAPSCLILFIYYFIFGCLVARGVQKHQKKTIVVLFSKIVFNRFFFGVYLHGESKKTTHCFPKKSHKFQILYT
jgi:hypothetical protein